MNNIKFWDEKFHIWDEFVQKDFVRNSLIIPHLIKSINEINGNDLRIADIGCGTGYIPFKLINSTNKIKKCICFDRSGGIIKLASRKYNHKNLEFKIHDIFNELTFKNFNLMYSVFTFLEFELTKDICQNIFNSFLKNGTLIIYIPDFLIDFLSNKNSRNFSDYVYGCSKGNKIDKNTKLNYPFFMNRIEYIILFFLETGFQLKSIESLEFNDSENKNRIFSLKFTR